MAERRRERRLRTLRSGKIVFNDRRSVIDCVVRNLSDSGTCLQVNSTVDIPATFELTLDGEETSHPCQVAWMSENRVGIEFRGSDASRAATEQDAKAHQSAADAAAAPPPTASPEPPGKGIVRGELIALWAAFDKVPVGIVLLDHESRAQFINCAFRKMWRLPDAKADAKPPFVALMYHGRDTRAYAIPSGDLDAYVASRVAHVKRGDPEPLDLRLNSGEIIRLQCTVLPNGGRMLCYTYVTDIVRRTDELETLRSALNNIEQGVVLLDPMLNAAFMNKAVRDLWKVSDELADRKPHFVELVGDARKTGSFDIPADELERFIANRVAIVRAGDPTPVDIPHGDGRIIRSQCAVLPAGGRMLTFTDITDLVDRAAQFEELATIDGLTGLYNRRQFNLLANAEWSRFQRYHRPLSVLALDIDGFKQINDGYGHDAGDRAIAHVAMLCREERRTTDIIGRMGGDEFFMLLPETTLAQAQVVAERLRVKVSERRIRPSDGQQGDIELRVSVGVAEATLSMSSVAVLLKMADQALYRAKLAGRNCVVAAETPAISDLGAAAE